MIRFFRKIRQRLLTENRARKYLLYALGEILLVVIGILIALQINNWNQNRIDRRTEKETLLSLRTDLDSALIQLDQKIEQNRIFFGRDSTALHLIHNSIKVSQDSLERLLLGHIITPGFDPELGTLNEILSTGKMDIIKSTELRRNISSWNKYMDELDEIDQILITMDNTIKRPLYIEILPYRNFYFRQELLADDNSYNTIDNPLASHFNREVDSIFYSLKMENLLSNYMEFGQTQYNRLLSVKNKINDMNTIISDYLSNN